MADVVDRLPKRKDMVVFEGHFSRQNHETAELAMRADALIAIGILRETNSDLIFESAVKRDGRPWAAIDYLFRYRDLRFLEGLDP